LSLINIKTIDKVRTKS